MVNTDPRLVPTHNVGNKVDGSTKFILQLENNLLINIFKKKKGPLLEFRFVSLGAYVYRILTMLQKKNDENVSLTTFFDVTIGKS